MFLQSQSVITTSLLASLLLLAACGGGSTNSSATATMPANTQSPEADARPACFTNDCAMPQNIATIPDAENMAFGPDRKLYVTGGTDVFRIDLADDRYTATGLSNGGCNFTGITFIGKQLYAACGDGSLWTADVESKPVIVSKFYQIAGLGLANGLTSSPNGDALLLADGPLPTNNITTGKIVKIELSEPGVAKGHAVWLDMPGRFPNGLQRLDNTIYLTESAPPALGQISRVDYGADGLPTNTAPTVVVSLPSIPDDFSLLPDGFAVTLFFDGSVAHYGFDGNLKNSTSIGRFETGASQVRVGQGPDFMASDLIVTAKGLIGDTFSPIGNKLFLYRRIN